LFIISFSSARQHSIKRGPGPPLATPLRFSWMIPHIRDGIVGFCGTTQMKKKLFDRLAGLPVDNQPIYCFLDTIFRGLLLYL